MNIEVSMLGGSGKCAAGVVLADGSVVRLEGEPPVRPPTVRMTSNGQR